MVVELNRLFGHYLSNKLELFGKRTTNDATHGLKNGWIFQVLLIFSAYHRIKGSTEFQLNERPFVSTVDFKCEVHEKKTNRNGIGPICVWTDFCVSINSTLFVSHSSVVLHLRFR